MKKLKTTLEIGARLNQSFDGIARHASNKLERATKSVRSIEAKQSQINQYQQLQKSITGTSRAINDNENKLHRLKRQLEKTDKPSRQLQRDFKQLDKETKKLKQALDAKQNRAKSLKGTLKNLGFNTEKLRHENAKLTLSMRLSQKRFEALSRISGADLKGKLSSIARQTRNASLAFAGLATAVGVAGFKLTKGVADSADSVKTLADRTGFSTEALQQWQYVTEMSGVPVEKLNASLDTFSKKLGKAQYGKGTLYSDLRQADSELYDELIAATNTQDAFEILVKRLRETQDKRSREAIIEATLGPLQMASLANLSAKEIENLKNKKLEMGIVTKKSIALGTAFSDNLTNVRHSVSGLKIKLAEQLLPSFNRLSHKLEGFVQSQGNDIQRWANTLGQTIEIFVPRFFAFSSGLLHGLNAIYQPIDNLITLFGGWERVAYGLGALLGGKLLLRAITFTKAIWTTVAAIRVLAITSLPRVMAGLASFSTQLLTLATSALPTIVTGIHAIGLAVTSSPIGLAVTALATGAGLVYANWSKVLSIFDGLKKRFSAFYKTLHKLSFGVFKRLFGKREATIELNEKRKKATPLYAKAAPLSALQTAKAQPHTLARTPQTQTNKVTQHITISMQTKDHQSHEAIAHHVIEKIKHAQQQKERGALYDY